MKSLRFLPWKFCNIWAYANGCLLIKEREREKEPNVIILIYSNFYDASFKLHTLHATALSYVERMKERKERCVEYYCCDAHYAIYAVEKYWTTQIISSVYFMHDHFEWVTFIHCLIWKWLYNEIQSHFKYNNNKKIRT